MDDGIMGHAALKVLVSVGGALHLGPSISLAVGLRSTASLFLRTTHTGRIPGITVLPILPVAHDNCR